MSAVAEAVKKPQRLGQKVRAVWVRDLNSFLSKVDTVVVAKVEKVPTRDLNRLRQALNGSLYVVKNSLCRIAFREKGWTDLEKSLEGTCAVSPIEGDPVAAAKLLVQFAKEHEGFVLRGGLLTGQAMDAKEFKALAALPSRQALLSQLAGVLQAPLRGLAFVMNAPIQGLAIALAAVAKKKDKPS
ncbi:MAG: 50S ribosomal protein L10 [Candidatus Omnitrophota bacterium]|nr:50S ribosomal protein L10 [Candidatus Omnitrophota bacterium]